MQNNTKSKPARLSKLESYWQDSPQEVRFEEQDVGFWCVYIQGYLAAHELAEIVRALKAVNKAGRL